MKINYFREPAAHAHISELLPPETYARLRFPEIAPRAMGRIGRDIYYGEPEWDALMSDPAWKTFSSAFMSEAFVTHLVAVFAEDMRAEGCVLEPSKIHLAQRSETREQTQAAVLEDAVDPHALFVRFDLQAVGAEYDKTVHCDHLRRLIGGVLFLTSAEDEGMDGGKFALYRDRAFNNDRHCHDPEIAKTFDFTHNQGVLFLNSNRGFHGPTPIQFIAGMRKWIYFSLSSTRDVWRRAPIRA